MNSEHLARFRAIERESRLVLQITASREDAVLQIGRSPEGTLAVERWRTAFPPELLPPGCALDLEGADLYGYLFVGPKNREEPLCRANFRNATLSRTKWIGSEIKFADFTSANLSGCEMTMVRASGTLFRSANLKDATLDLICLERDDPIDFTDSNLDYATIVLSDACSFIFTGATVAQLALVIHEASHDKAHSERIRESFLSCLSEEQRQQIVPPVQRNQSRCFIAGAAYSDPAHSAVRELRMFRDEHLVKSMPGRAFIRAYEFISPGLADIVCTHSCPKQV